MEKLAPICDRCVMTMVLAWTDRYGAYICADSVASHKRPPRDEQTSFGELQVEAGSTREEMSIKVLRLPGPTLAAICGDASAGISFLHKLEKHLRLTKESLESLLNTLPIDLDDERAFAAVFATISAGALEVKLFNPYGLSAATIDQERKVIILGSLPAQLRERPTAIAYKAQGLPLPPEGRLAAVLTSLQSHSVTNSLMKHGIGGAFFGAHISTQGVLWQPEISYLCYRMSPNGNEIEDETRIRVLVKDEIGVVISGVKDHQIKAFPSPLRSELPSFDKFFKSLKHLSTLSIGQHYGFLNKEYPNAIYYYCADPVGIKVPFFKVKRKKEQLDSQYHHVLAKEMKRSTASSDFDFSVYIDREPDPICYSQRFEQ